MTPDTAALTSLRELDGKWSVRKGTAFRAFKRALPGLVEGRDFIYLNAERERTEIERLRNARRIYASSINVVMLSASGIAKLTIP